MNVIQMEDYLAKKEDSRLDDNMVLAQNILGDVLQEVDYDSATTYFLWRNLADILMQGMDWEPDMMRSGLEFDIRMAENSKDETDETETTNSE